MPRSARLRPGSRRLPATPLLAVALAVTSGLAACGGDGTSSGSTTSGGTESGGGTAAELLADGGTVLVANSAGTLSANGPQRLLVALLGGGPNDLLGGPDVPATVEIRSLQGDVVDRAEGQWLSAPGSPLGMYRAEVTFPGAGQWEVGLADYDGPGFTIQVDEDAAIPEPGDEAPRSKTPTASTEAELAEVSTDPEPVARFYELSIDEAVTSGRPTIVVFATPAFCQTATCGPTVELVKEVATKHPDVNVVHVEPYDIELAHEGTLEPAAVLEEWGLVTEPWVFLVDDEGRIGASFEGLVGTDELDRAIARL